MGEIRVRDARSSDVAALTDIQNALIPSTTIEWRDEPYSVDSRREWLQHRQTAGYPVLVATDAAEVVGFASFDDFRDTTKWPGYRYAVEHTVHVRESHWGAGVGRALVTALIDRARALGKHVLVAAIDAANDGSVQFHERLGFVEVGRMLEVGAKHGGWCDLVVLQLTLDERPRPSGGDP